MKGQKGFTLSELVTSMGVFSILVLIASVLSSWAIYRYYSVRDRLIAEGLAYRAEATFRNVFGQAVDVDYTVGTVPQSLTGRSGVIFHNAVMGRGRGFMFDRNSITPVWSRIATFYREQGTGIGTAARSQLMKTAIFYRRPSGTTSGVIFFDLSSPATSNALVSPGYDDFFVDRVSTFGMTKFSHPLHDQTTSVEVLLRFRYHTFAGRGTNWCPQRDIASGAAGCGVQTTWRDLERRFVVVLSDNLLKTSGYRSSAVNTEERTLGNLYLFRIINPLRYQ